MYAMITINGWGSTWSKITREVWEEIRAAIPQFKMSEWKPEAEKAPHVYLDDVLIDLTTDGPLLLSHGIEFEVKRFKNTYMPGRPARAHMPNGYSYETEGPIQYNMHLHIPNVGLLAIDEVYVLEDACTDQLQGMLTDGWRIVAVCPPNAARRPDYVLGRTKERN